MIKYFARTFTAALLVLCASGSVYAQQATGTSGTTCTQSGSVVTCNTSTTFSLPSGVALQPGASGSTFSFAGAAVVGPACTGLTATPPSVQPNTPTNIALTVAGCPSGVSYTWASPVTQLNSFTVGTNLTTAVSQPYSVTVCFDANPNACNTYNTTVTLIGGTPALAGCTITPSTTTVAVNATPTLSASCTAGIGATYGVTYQWSKNGTPISGATNANYTLTTTDTAVASTTLNMSVAISNNLPSSLSPTSTVNVTGIQTNFCPGGQSHNATIMASEIYAKIYSSNLIGNTTHWVIRVPVGTSDTTFGRQLAQLSWAEAPSNQRAGRKISISKNLCDYTASAGTTYLLTSSSNTGARSIYINDPSAPVGLTNMTTGTWYINVTNTSCPANGSCQALVEWLN